MSEESFDAKEGIVTNSPAPGKEMEDGLVLNGLTVKEAITKTKQYIAEKGLGRVKVNFRLRDAIFSRQRYWGEPFPVYYKEGQPYMEFGALQCTPNAPDCANCPLADSCFAKEHNLIASLPVKGNKTKVTHRYFHHFIVLSNGILLLNKRTKKDIWQNLYEFPLYESSDPMELPDIIQTEWFQSLTHQKSFQIITQSNEIKHLLSHQTIHAAIVEIYIHDRAEVKYSTVQNWYPGDKNGKGGIYNFVTKRALCKGESSKVSWTQVETGSAITWKYPSCILAGDNSSGEFYSVAVTNNYQQADTGTKMIHIGKNTKSHIVSKGISAGKSQNSYRGLVRVSQKAENARNYSQCDSLLLGSECGAHTFPYMALFARNQHIGQKIHFNGLIPITTTGFATATCNIE